MADCGSRRAGRQCPVAGQVAWRLWGRAAAARPRSRFLSHGFVLRSNRSAAAQRGVWYSDIMPSRRTPGGKRKAADLVPASEALSATLQGSGRILTPRQPGSSPGVAAAKAKAQVRRWRHARTHLQTMSVFFCINRARAAAGPLRRSRAGGMDCSARV